MWKERIYIGSVTVAAETKIEWMNELRPFWSEISSTVKTLLQNKLTPGGLHHPWIVFARHWTNIAVLFALILRQMISRCQVCMFGPSHRPSRLGFHMKIYLDLTFPPKCVSDNASRRLQNSKRRIIFLLFLYFKINSSISRKLKGITCLIHEKYHKTTINIIRLPWLVRRDFRKWPCTDKNKNLYWLFTDPIFGRLFTVVLRIKQQILSKIFNDGQPVGVRLLFV